MTNDTSVPKSRSHHIEKRMQGLIPHTPENVAFALVNTPPETEDEWDYLKENKG